MNSTAFTGPKREEEISSPVRLGWLRTRVDNLLAEKKLTAKWLYELIGMTKTGYRQMWERDSLRVDTLHRIAHALGTTPMDLLADEPRAAPRVSEPVAPYGKRYLEQRVDDLERDVQALKAKLKR